MPPVPELIPRRVPVRGFKVALDGALGPGTEVLRRIAARDGEGLVAHLRAVAVRSGDQWLPLCGRIDIARPEDAPIFSSTPRGDVRLLVETAAVADVVERLRAAFQGDALVVAGVRLDGHGMDDVWSGIHLTDEWRDEGASRPLFRLSPQRGVARPEHIWEAVESDRDDEAFDGSQDCVAVVMGYRDRGGPGHDMRFTRFQILEWDYGGVVAAIVRDGLLRISVQPPNDTDLTLALVVRDTTNAIRKTLRAPGTVDLPIGGPLLKGNLTLRRAGEVVCDLRWNKLAELAAQRLGAVMVSSGVAPEGLDQGLNPAPESTVASLALAFVRNKALARMVARDLAELDRVAEAGAAKAAVLLTGSILEAVLLDVLGRNEPEALKRLGNKWPERASLKDLIAAASAIQVSMSEGPAALLPPLTGTKGEIVTDHRDLIHPRAEVRGQADIDGNTVGTMRGLLGEILRDLRQADERGVLTEYEAGNLIV